MVSHANILANLDTSAIGWDTEKAVSICMRTIFHIADFPAMFAATGFRWRAKSHDSKVHPARFL